MLGLPLLSIVMYPMAVVIGLWRSGLVWVITYERRASLWAGRRRLSRGAARDFRPARAIDLTPTRVQGRSIWLLHLCQTHELDILNIPIAFVAEKYCDYLDMKKTWRWRWRRVPGHGRAPSLSQVARVSAVA